MWNIVKVLSNLHEKQFDIEMKKLFLLIIVYLISTSVFAQHEIWNNLDKGNFQVGFKVLSLYDSSRTIDKPNGFRPVQVSMWYPANNSDKSARITYKDYFLLSAKETNYKTSKSLTDGALVNYKKLLAGNGIADSSVDKWFNTKMLASKNAQPIKDIFPLVVVAQGNFHSAHHQAFLCEFLASYGYVVITTPSQTRITGQLTDVSQAVASAEEQIEDMEFAISAVKKFNDIDFNNIALLGHSFGGRSIPLLQMKNKNVRCLVSLDGGVGLNTAVDDIKKSPGFSSEKMDVPLLHFYEDTETMLKPDFRLIDSFNKSKRFLVKINDMHHFYFSSLGLVSGAINGFHPLSKNLAGKYKLICDFTRDFLNSVFTGKDLEMSKLKKEFSVINVKNNLIEFEYRD